MDILTKLRKEKSDLQKEMNNKVNKIYNQYIPQIKKLNDKINDLEVEIMNKDEQFK